MNYVSLFLWLFFVFFYSNVKGETIRDNCFQIGEFNDGKLTLDYLKRSNIVKNTGLSIEVTYSHDNNQLYLSPQSSGVTFDAFANQLNTYLNLNPQAVFPLFINHSGPENWIIDELNTSGLSSKAFYLPPGERWPGVDDILESGKQLIIFTSFSNTSGSKSFNYAWDHIAEFPFSSFNQSLFEGFYTNGAIENELMLLRDFTYLNTKTEGLPPAWDNLNTNTFLLDHALKCWKQSGKKPNFIFFSEPKHELTMNWLLRMLNPYSNITGKVNLLDKPLKQVKWNHDKQFITNGNFNFPITEGYELELRPSALGFNFSPTAITITEEMNDPIRIIFDAIPLSYQNELTGFFDFNEQIENALRPKDKFSLNKCEFTTDIVRGEVLKLHNSAHLSLNKVSDFGIVNNSFTMSVWFKLTEIHDTSDFCILGTNENEYRKGLHINIRNRTPYFGFFNNDVTSFEKIEPMKWYQMAIRYNIENGEQSIFINGIKTGTSNNHPSFIGESELLLGHGISQNNFFDGYVDELCIWKRALSDDEIMKLHSSGFSVNKKMHPSYYMFLSILGLISLLLLLYFLVVRPRKKTNFNYIIEDSVANTTAKNSIVLFGDFTAIDKKGQNISSSFSPKIKEVFLIILLYSLRSEKGISTQNLTEKIWSGFSVTKASNNRGVTLNKLKKIISRIEGIEVFYDDGYWKANITSDLHIDYKMVVELLKLLDIQNPENYAKLFNLIKRGQFLDNMDWQWADDFKTNLSFELTDALLVYSKILIKAAEYDQLYNVAKVILRIDDLNEQAIHYQLNYLSNKGHHSKSKFIFDQFCENYRKCYGQAYRYNFIDFLKRNPDHFE